MPAAQQAGSQTPLPAPGPHFLSRFRGSSPLSPHSSAQARPALEFSHPSAHSTLHGEPLLRASCPSLRRPQALTPVNPGAGGGESRQSLRGLCEGWCRQEGLAGPPMPADRVDTEAEMPAWWAIGAGGLVLQPGSVPPKSPILNADSLKAFTNPGPVPLAGICQVAERLSE